jgi:hypothetical protein
MPRRIFANRRIPGRVETGERLPHVVAARKFASQECAARKDPHLQSMIQVAGVAPARGSFGQLQYPIWRFTMSLIDEALRVNHTYAKNYDRKLGAHQPLRS